MEVTTEEETCIKLADQFINVIDFHADFGSGITHSSGTVSYDSIPQANGRNDRQLHVNADFCAKQPPRPPFVSKKKRLMSANSAQKVVQIDMDMFNRINRQLHVRNKPVEGVKEEMKRWTDVNKKLEDWLDSTLDALSSPATATATKTRGAAKKMTEMRIFINRRHPDDIILTKKTMPSAICDGDVGDNYVASVGDEFAMRAKFCDLTM